MLFQGREQIIEGGRGEGMLLEVIPRARVKIIAAHVVHELLEHGRALGIGNAIEVLARGIHVRNLGLDGVRGGKLILQVGPVFALAGEVDPRLFVGGGVHGGIGAHELREGFFEPEIIPPLRGDKIAEPHVGHLVQNGICARGLLAARGLRAEDIAFRKGHQARVLHGAEVIFRHEDGIVLAPRVGKAEVLVEIVHALRGKLQDFLVQILKHGGAGKGAQLRGVIAIRRVPGAFLILIRPSGKRGEVRRKRRGGRKADRGIVPVLLALGLRLVGEDLPVLRRGHGDVERRLEVGLLKAREDAAGIGRLEVRVQIGRVIGLVVHAVQTLARARVARGATDLNRQLLPYR